MKNTPTYWLSDKMAAIKMATERWIAVERWAKKTSLHCAEYEKTTDYQIIQQEEDKNYNYTTEENICRTKSTTRSTAKSTTRSTTRSTTSRTTRYRASYKQRRTTRHIDVDKQKRVSSNTQLKKIGQLTQTSNKQRRDQCTNSDEKTKGRNY